MADSAPPSMWTYYRDKHGSIEAIQNYYPELLKERPDLMAAVQNARVALGYIDSEMDKLEDPD